MIVRWERMNNRETQIVLLRELPNGKWGIVRRFWFTLPEESKVMEDAHDEARRWGFAYPDAKHRIRKVHPRDPESSIYQ